MASRTAELIARLVDQVSGPAKGMAGALKGTVSALDALKAKAGKIDAFKQASRSLDDAAQKFKQAQQNVRRIKQEMDAAGDGGKKLASSLKSAERAAEAAKNVFRNQGQAVREMRAALAEAGIPINRLAAYERQLKVETDLATASLKRQERAAEKLASSAKSGNAAGALANRAAAARSGGGLGGGSGAVVGAGVARFGVAAAGLGGTAYVLGDQVRRAAKSSMDFERSMIEVGKATDTSGDELNGYGEKLLKLSRETGKTKEDLASMLSQAGFAGRPKEELMDFTEYASKATVAWGTSAEETADAMAQMGNIFGANQKRIEEMGDAINTMADNSASKESDLLEFLRRAGASGKEAGIGAEQMLAFGAAMKEVGVRNETAGTAMEAFLNVMKLGAKFGKPAGKALEALGINSDKMRKSFAAKPVETMIEMLEKLNKVSDPLKKAEIMTGLFGKEYQDDMAKLLNALPQINKYLGIMGDKAAIAKGGVRFQFGQNLDKDVMKIDRATAAIDVLYKRLGDPIKVQAGGVAEQINSLVDRIEQGDTILQRLMKRLSGNETGQNIELPENALEKQFEEAFPALSGKTWNDWFDEKVGKTGADTIRKNREDADAKRAAERQAILDRPSEIDASIARQRELRARSQREAGQVTGMRRSAALGEAKRTEGEISRLQGELAQAWEAIGALRAQEKRDGGAFGVGGPNAKEQTGIGPGRFGFGLHGTDQAPARNVPLPPPRPAGAGETIAPKTDPAALVALTGEMEKVRTKAGELTGLNITVPASAPGLGTIIQQMQQIISLGPQVSAAMSPGGMRTGKAAQAIQNSTSDRS